MSTKAHQGKGGSTTSIVHYGNLAIREQLCKRGHRIGLITPRVDVLEGAPKGKSHAARGAAKVDGEHGSSACEPQWSLAGVRNPTTTQHMTGAARWMLLQLLRPMCPIIIANGQ